jgi:hypothetical protein
LIFIGCVEASSGCSTDSSGEGPPLAIDASTDSSVTADAGDSGNTLPEADATLQPDAMEDLDAALDVTVGADVAVDAADAAPCSGVVCNGACLSASDCRGCAGAPLLCGPTGTCMADCSSCAGSNDASLPVECFACDSNRQNPIGTCSTADPSQYCLNGSYLGSYAEGANGYHCPCGDAGAPDCPGSDQVCAPTPNGGHTCITCGESYLYDVTDAACKNGLSCDPSSFSCR